MPVVEHESPRPPQRTAALAFGIYERRSRLLWSLFYILVKPSLWCEGGAQSRSASPEHVVAHQPARGWFVKNSCTLHTTSADAHSSCDRSVLALTTPICIHMTGLRLATIRFRFHSVDRALLKATLSKSSRCWFAGRESRYIRLEADLFCRYFSTTVFCHIRAPHQKNSMQNTFEAAVSAPCVSRRRRRCRRCPATVC